MNAVKKMLPQFHSLYTAPRNEPVKEYVPLGKLSPQEGWGFSEVFHFWGRYRRCTRKGWHIMVKASRYFFKIYPKDPSWFKEEFLKNDNRGQRIHQLPLLYRVFMVCLKGCQVRMLSSFEIDSHSWSSIHLCTFPVQFPCSHEVVWIIL